jgi:hypothetical protein
MTGPARAFFIGAIAFALAGMALGLSMAISNDHGEMPTHAHMMVLGWLSFSVFAFFYHAFPAAAASLAARIHVWLAIVSAIVLAAALFLFYRGNAGIEPLAAISSIAYFVSMCVFAWAAWPVLFGENRKIKIASSRT